MSERAGAPAKSKVWRKLSNEGPQPISGKIQYQLKQDGVRKFNPRSNYHGNAIQGGGQKESIWYIDGKHDPETVIQKWLDVNESRVAELPNKALHWRIKEYGEEFKKASREILGPFGEDHNGQYGGASPGECPICGEDYEFNLPTHLAECKEK